MIAGVVVARPAVLEPLGVPAGGCPIGAVTLDVDRARTLRQVLGQRGALRVVDDHATIAGPAVVVAGDVWITAQMLRRFVKQARSQSAPVVLGLASMLQQHLFGALQDVDVTDGVARYDVAFVPRGQSALASALFSAATTVLPVAIVERPMPVPTPPHLLPSTDPLAFPLTASVVMRIRHWLHVLRASHLAPQVALFEAARARPLASVVRAFAGLRVSSTSRMEAWKRQFVFVGKNTFIHKTAVVEASVIGSGCFIGPHAVVLQSVVGHNVRIEQRAHVAQSTLGDGVFVSLNSSLSASAVFAGASPCANGIQACVVGPRVGLTSFARPLDTHGPTGAVRVFDGGKLRDAGPLPCGVCFGADCYVGADVRIAAGRAVPAGRKLFADAATAVRGFEP
jgi:NDP-sugar pyrophosphorylase family protein